MGELSGGMEDVVSNEYLYVDSKDDGTPYCRNLIGRIPSAAPVPKLLRDLPFGHGASVFDLGRQPAFLAQLASTEQGLQSLGETMAATLPVDCPRNTRVQLSTQDDPDLPAFAAKLEDAPLMMCVWGHEPEAASALQKQLEADCSLATERGEVYSMQDLVGAKRFVQCDEQSRVYRRRVGKQVLDALVAGHQLQLPEMLLSSDKKSIYDTMNFNQVRLIPEADDCILCGCDANIGQDALVFHSPQRGSTLMLGTDPDAVGTGETTHESLMMPACDGRTINTGDTEAIREENPMALLGLQHTPETELVDCIKEANQVAPGQALHSAVAVQQLPLCNDYRSFEGIEATYRKCAPLELAMAAPSKTQYEGVYRLRSLATAFPAMQRSNSLLAGRLPCNTVKAVLDFTPPTTSQVLFPNTPEWQRELTSADKSGRPFRYMNENTAVASTDPASGGNTITHYSVDRTEFGV